MALSLHNTQTRKKEQFEPLDATRVGMYVCGPTVYDLAHIGNARPIVVFDLLYRLLRNIYGEDSVIYVRNITDVDDKINAAAQASGEPISAITARTTKAFHEDIFELNALPPDVEPHVLLITHEIGAVKIVFKVQTLDNAILVIHIQDVLIITQPQVGTVGFVSRVFDLYHDLHHHFNRINNHSGRSILNGSIISSKACRCPLSRSSKW